MTKSFMEYRGRGFWTPDFFAELWLYLLCREIDELTFRPHWLVVARRDWRTQATVGFTGNISCCFDTHLGDRADRVELVAGLAGQVRQQVLAYGSAIPREAANEFGTGGPARRFTTDVDTEPLLRVGKAFEGLLRAEHPESSSDSPTIPD